LTSTVPTQPTVPGLEVPAVEPRRTPSRGAAPSLRRRATALLDAIVGGAIAFVCAFLGIQKYEEVEGTYCSACRDVHETGDDCGTAKLAQCVECVDVVELTHEDRCPNGARHVVVNRRPKLPKLTARLRGASPAKSPERIGAAAG
jgi:hypothetical protein